MKKITLVLFLIVALVVFASCAPPPEDPPVTDPNGTEDPVDEDPTTPSEDPTEPPKNNEDPADEVEDPAEEANLTIEDYYPFLSDTEYVYAGQGNEYASYKVTTDFFDKDINRVQTITNNGGTEVLKVMEIKTGTLSLIFSRGESYYRDNLLRVDRDDLLREEMSDADTEILLKEPLVKGTQWTLADNRNRSISDTEVKIDTPAGSYTTLEVTTEGPNGTTKDYYAPEIGLVKSVFTYESTEVTSTLSEIKKNTPTAISIEFFYPHQDQKIYSQAKTVSFHTNDISRINIQEVMSEQPPQDTMLPLISTDTKINSLYLGRDNVAYVDFSEEFIHDMNAGAYYESLILQSVVNTIGNYYGTERVYLTIDSEPYESGHILLERGEVLQVNMDSVVR